MTLTYSIHRERDGNGTVLITAPDLPEVTTFSEGADFMDALGPAAAAIEEAIAARMAVGDDVPSASTSGREFVTVGDPLFEAKVELYRALRGAGLNRAELARRLGWKRTSVDRLFQLDHASRLSQIDKALEKLGYRLRLSLERIPETA